MLVRLATRHLITALAEDAANVAQETLDQMGISEKI